MDRVFAALPLPDDFKEGLAESLAGLRDAHPELRWTPDENLHLTLLFLGEVPREDAALLAEAAEAAAAETPPPRVSAGGLIGLPSRGAARILGLDFAAGGDEIRALAARLRTALFRSSGEAGRQIALPAARQFRPHVTLARAGRFRLLLGADEWATPVEAEGILGSLAVFKSDLRPAGPRYTPLAGFPLGGR